MLASGQGAAITVRGYHHDLVFRGNTIGSTEPSATSAVGILRDEQARGLRSEGNKFLNVRAEVETAK